VKFIAYRAGLQASLYSLGEHLEDVRPAQAVEPIYIDKGRGFVLPDESLALFGYVYKGGPYTAAMARVAPSGKTESTYTFEPPSASFTVAGALSLAADRFVIARFRAGPTPAESGTVVSWVIFK
jgi:hypothetical protein